MNALNLSDMTDVVKIIIQYMLAGCSIVGSGSSGYRLRSPDHSPILKINPRTWRQIRHLMRKGKYGLFLIDKRKVRSLHGNSWIKKNYKKQIKPS